MPSPLTRPVKSSSSALGAARRRISLLAALLALLGCEPGTDGPIPVIEAPDAGPSALDPGWVCRDQLTTEVALNGRAFSPSPIDVPGDPRTALPRVTLTAARGLDGAALAEPEVVVFGGERGQGNADHVVWQSQNRMTLTVDQALMIGPIEAPEAQVEDRMPAAVYDVRVQNPTGREGEFAAQLAAIDKPTLGALTPSVVCLEQGPRTVRVDGASLAVIDGQEIVVDFGETTGFPVGAFDGCADVPHQAVPGRLCTGADIPLDPESVPVGYHPVNLQNPDPAGCRSEEDIRLRVVPRPQLTAVRPPLACVAEGDREAVLVGQDLLEIDGVLPAVQMTAEDGSPRAIEVVSLGGDCVDLEAQGHTVRACTEATVVLPQDDTLAAPYAPTFTLDNPAPAGCTAVLEDALILTPPPRVDVAVPPAVCTAENDRPVELRGEGFIEVDGVSPEVVFGELVVEVVDYAECADLPVVGLTVRRCASMTVNVPAGALPVDDGALFGQPHIRVTNPAPAGCGHDSDGVLTVLPSPTITAAQPPLLCNDQSDRQVVIEGTGFLVYDGIPPAVTLAETPVEVVASDGCADVPVAGAAVQNCTALTLALPVGTLTVPVEADALVAAIVITNPEPVGCGATNQGALVAVPAPRVTALAPAMVCDQGPTSLDAIGDGFITVDGMPPTVTLDGMPLAPDAIAPSDCVPLVVDRLDVQSCDRLTLTFDPATVDDAFEVAVQNPDPAGCGFIVEQQVPVVPPPVIDDVTPDPVCTADGERTLTVTGSGFMQVGDALPGVRIGDAELAPLAAEGCVETTVGDLTWQTCDTLTVTAPQGSLSAGRPSMIVTNPPPAGCATVLDEALTVPPSPTLIAVAPRSVCIEAGDRVIDIEGAGFLRVAGVAPELRLGGQVFPVEAITGCAPVAGAADVESCTGLTTTVRRGSLPEGDVLVEVINTGDGVCDAAAAELFDIVPVPRIDAIEPQAVCEQVGQVFTIRGANFTDVSVVDIGPYANREVQFVDEATLVVTVDDEIQPGLYDVGVTNADGCATTADAALRVAPRPVVFFVDPPVTYDGIALQVTVYTTGLEAPPGEVRFEGPGGEVEILPGVPRPDRPNQIRVDLPAGLPVGLWSVQVTSDLGCVGRLDDGLTITDDLRITLGAVSPRFVAPDEATAITLDADVGGGGAGFVSTPRAYVSPNPPVPGAPASALRAVTFVGADLLTAVVPAGLAPGDYDLIVVNPDATVGVLEQALTVVADTPPVIDEILPASLDGNGAQAVELRGRGFDPAGVSVAMTCRDPGGQVRTADGGVQGAIEPDRLTAVLPGDQFGAGAVCLVRLTNADGAFFDYSAVSIKTPAQNLNDWEAGPEMTEARRIPALIAGRPTERSRFLYAIGGDAGDRASASSTVEAAQVGVFGDLGPWSPQRNALPAPRTLAGAATAGRYVYLVGGHDGAGAVDTVWRARVLDPLAGPEVVDLALFLDDEVPGIGPGVWHYRIAAEFPPGSDNPGGEGLPGEVLVVQLPDTPGLELLLSWAAVPGASGYRVYRTPAAGDPVDTVRLLATVAGDVTEFVDDGTLDVGDDTPLPPGSLGVWHPAGTLTTARAGAAVVSAEGPDGSYLYAIGGEGPDGQVLDTIEVAPLDADGDAGPFAELGATLGAARADLRAWVLTADDAAAIPAGESWIFVGPGRTDGGNSRTVEASPVMAGGDLGLIATDNVNADVAGYGYGSANGFLFVFGRGGADPDGGGISGELCVDVGGGCRAPVPPDIRNWNALGVSFIVPRAYMGSTQESAFFFVAGGMGPGGVPLSSTELTVQ